MATAERHMVETALFHISFGDEAHAFEQQAELGRFVSTDLLPVVDELFDAYAGDDVVRIETLELDLGSVPYADYREELPKRLRQELAGLLSGLRSKARHEMADDERVLSRNDSLFEQIGYFLLHGRLPWQSRLDGAGLERALQTVLENDAERLLHFIAQNPQRQIIIERLASQFPLALALMLMRRISAPHALAVADMVERLQRIWRRPGVTLPCRLDQLLNRFIYRCIDALLGGAASQPPQALIERLLHEACRHDLGIGAAALATLFDQPLPQIETLALPEAQDEQPDPGAVIVQALQGGRIDALEPIWTTLFDRHAGLLETVLRDYGQQAQVRRRIAFQFPERYIRDIVVLIEPLEHAVVESVVAQAKMFPPGPDAVPADGDAKKRLWHFTLGYLLVERGSRFNKKSYLDSLIRQQAAHDNLSYAQVLHELGANLDQLATATPALKQMRQLLLELAEALPAANGSEAEADATPLYEAYEQRDLLLRFFDSGAAAAVDETRLCQAVAWLARQRPALLLDFYRRLQARPPHWRSALEQAGAPLLRQLLISFLGLRQGETDGRSDLLDAMLANAARCANQALYFAKILTCLLDGGLIDFETIMADPRLMVAAKDADPGKTNATTNKGVSALPPSVGEKELQRLHRYLGSDAGLTASEAALMVSCFEQLCRTRQQDMARLLAALMQDGRALQRLIDVLPESLLARSLALLQMSELTRLLQNAELISSACHAGEIEFDAVLLRRLKWSYLFAYVEQGGRLFNEAAFVRGYVEHLTAQTQQSDAAEFRARLSRQLALNILPSTQATMIRIMAIVTQQEGASGKPLMPLPQTPTATKSQAKQEDEAQQAQENIYIANAGLVLATPYLPRLFEMLGLTEKGAFKDRDTAVRGAHLLQFMVNESSAAPEYLLPLNKLLCGIKSGQPIARGIEVSAQEKEVVEGLLRGMIQNWKALGNTSVAALREAFLQREGRLQLRDDAWHLLVEAKAYDMLLDQIPWGYSTIKYAWMERVIYVEWR